MRHNNLSKINLKNSSLKGIIQLANYGVSKFLPI